MVDVTPTDIRVYLALAVITLAFVVAAWELARHDGNNDGSD